jgi:hypothetical protein
MDSIKVGDQVSHPYKTTDESVVLHINDSERLKFLKWAVGNILQT